MTTTPPPGWYPDPHRRHEQRWWDGQAWTAHVSTGGQQGHDDPAAVVAQHRPEQIRHQVHQQAGIAGGGPGSGAGGGTIWTEPILVVNQKAKLIEIENEYAVFDQGGQQIAAVRQVGQSTARKVLRVLTDVDQFLSTTLQVVDRSGAVQMVLSRPGKFLKSTVVVQGPGGGELGRIVQRNAIGKIRFGLEAGGYEVGSLNAENWRAWNFAIADHTGVEVARITKTWEGFAKTLFTTADNYVVQIHRPLQDPLRALVVASALSVDTALKQDSRGFS